MGTLEKRYVLELFNTLANGDQGSFFDRVADDVDWTITGRHPIAGRYRRKEDFLAAIKRIDNALDKRILFKVECIHIDGTNAVVEMESVAVAKNGETFNNAYCWITTFDSNGIIIKVKAYVDSASVAKLLAENEKF